MNRAGHPLVQILMMHGNTSQVDRYALETHICPIFTYLIMLSIGVQFAQLL